LFYVVALQERPPVLSGNKKQGVVQAMDFPQQQTKALYGESIPDQIKTT
jgi:hypothetical protein